MAHQVRELLDQLSRTARAAADAAICTYSIPEGELCGLLADATRLVRQLEGGVVMPLVAEIDERGAYKVAGKGSTTQVLTDAGVARTRANKWVKTTWAVAGPGSDLGATGMRCGRDRSTSMPPGRSWPD